MDTKDLTVCVVDHGLFLPLAQKLAEQVKRVIYWTPWEEAFPTVKRCVIGDGFEGIERVESIWPVKSEVGLWVFPDIGFAGMQQELEAQGALVWGSRNADELEINRGKFLRTLAQLELPVPEYTAVKGITNLRLHLKDKEDKWLKISKYRGDIETAHWRDWQQDEGLLDFWAFKLGPMREQITFYVLDQIETEVEDGLDTWCVDGQFPKLCIHGMEKKDQSYIGTFQAYADMPEEVTQASNAFASVLKAYGYRNFFSTEVRITAEGESYFIDPTCRMGSPPSQVMTEMIGNLAEILYAGAQGECVEPEPVAQFGVQAILKHKGDRTQWREVELPQSLRQWVKCGFCCEVDGRLAFPPDTCDDIGWVVATGDSIKEAIGNLREHVEELPDGVCCEFASLADLLKEINEAEKSGMEFTDQPIPNPAVILDGK